MRLPFRFNLLGGLHVVLGSEETAPVVTRFRTRKTAALLAFLACHSDRAHRREELIDRFWPDADFETARVSLRTALSSLRHQIEPPGIPMNAVLRADRTNVRLETGATRIDVVQFEAALAAARNASHFDDRLQALRVAAALYQGPLLPGFYEDWALIRREHLAELHRQAIRQLAGDLSRSGALPEALACVRHAAAADPQDADLQELLARFLALGEKPNSEFLLPQPGRTGNPGVIPEPAAATNTAPILTMPTGNLPPTLNRFFGRQDEQERIATLLGTPSCRLVSLVGPGGTGKTRLAQEAAGGLDRAEWPGGLWFVSLADTRDADAVAMAIRDAFHLPAQATTDPIEQVIGALSSRGNASPLLLILDNFEQIVAEGTPLVRRLMRGLPQLKCLVTSRRRLALPGEETLSVVPLPIPESTEEPDSGALPLGEVARIAHIASIASIPSVQLFVDRARAARPDFQLTARNMGSVAELCVRLQGIPLAIELAAAWAMTLSPARMCEHLAARSPDLLRTRRPADREARHHSLNSTIAWSVDRLAPELQRFWMSLSLFRGGWTAEAAAVVGDEPSRALDYLTQLRERSLIEFSEGKAQGETRFRMLEPLREFAAERLTATGEEGRRTGLRYARHFCQWGIQAAPDNDTSACSRESLDAIEDDHENLRLALETCADPSLLIEQEADASAGDLLVAGLKLSGALRGFWSLRRQHESSGLKLSLALLQRWETAGRDISPHVLPHIPPHIPAQTLTTAAVLARGTSDYTLMERLLDRAMPLARASRDLVCIAEVLQYQASLAFRRSLHEIAAIRYRRAFRLFRRCGHLPGMSAAYNGLGNLALEQNALPAARGFFEESVQLARKAGDRVGMAHALGNLGIVSFYENRFEDAACEYSEALDVWMRFDNAAAIANTLGNLALVELEQNRLDAAERRLEKARDLLQRMADFNGLINVTGHLARIAFVRENWKLARRLTEEAIVLARKAGSRRDVSAALVNAAGPALRGGDPQAARDYSQASLQQFVEMDGRDGVAYSLETLAEVSCVLATRVESGCAHSHGVIRSAHLYGAADALRLAIGFPLNPGGKEDLERQLERLQRTLGAEAFAAAFAHGQTLDYEAAVALGKEV